MDPTRCPSSAPDGSQEVTPNKASVQSTRLPYCCRAWLRPGGGKYMLWGRCWTCACVYVWKQLLPENCCHTRACNLQASGVQPSQLLAWEVALRWGGSGRDLGSISDPLHKSLNSAPSDTCLRAHHSPSIPRRPWGTSHTHARVPQGAQACVCAAVHGVQATLIVLHRPPRIAKHTCAPNSWWVYRLWGHTVRRGLALTAMRRLPWKVELVGCQPEAWGPSA